MTSLRTQTVAGLLVLVLGLGTSLSCGSSSNSAGSGAGGSGGAAGQAGTGGSGGAGGGSGGMSGRGGATGTGGSGMGGSGGTGGGTGGNAGRGGIGGGTGGTAGGVGGIGGRGGSGGNAGTGGGATAGAGGSGSLAAFITGDVDGVTVRAETKVVAYWMQGLAPDELWAQAGTGTGRWDIQVLNSVGSRSCPAAYLTIPSPPGGTSATSNPGWTCTVTVTAAAPQVGDILQGTFTATFSPDGGTPRTVSNGAFRVPRTAGPPAP